MFSDILMFGEFHRGYQGIVREVFFDLVEVFVDSFVGYRFVGLCSGRWEGVKEIW